MTTTTEHEPGEAAAVEPVASESVSLQLVDEVTNSVGRKFSGIYSWLEANPYRMLPPSVKPIAALVTTVAFFGLSMAPVGYFLYAEYLEKTPQVYQHNIKMDEG